MSRKIIEWGRQEGESAKAYQAFEVYRDMGADRSLDAVGQKCSKSVSLLSRWSADWEWVKRCDAYDAEMFVVEQMAKEKALQSEAEKWAKREIKIADALYQKAKEMLLFPLVQERTEETSDDENVTIINITNPVRWNMKDAATMADTAVKLARLARGAETDIKKIIKDVTELTDEQLDRLIERLATQDS